MPVFTIYTILVMETTSSREFAIGLVVPAAPCCTASSTTTLHVAIPVSIRILVRISAATMLRISSAITHCRPSPAILRRRTTAHQARRGGGSKGRDTHMLRIHHVRLVGRGVHPLRPVSPPWQNLHLCVMEISGRRTLVTTGAGWRRTRATQGTRAAPRSPAPAPLAVVQPHEAA